MACTSLTALPRICGAEGLMGGLDKLFVISYNDLGVATGATNGAYYTFATNGMVNNIGLDSGKKFVEVGLLQRTSNLDEKLTKDITKGTAFLTQTLKFVLSDLTLENKTFLENVINQPVAVLVKTRSGKYYFAGGSGNFQLTDLEGGTGTSEGDLIGYTVTFSGVDSKLIAQVDDTIISTLI